MIVSFILNTEYMKIEERIKWFLKSASYAKKQDVLLVTHEYMKTHLREMIGKLGDRFYGDYEMEHLTADEVEQMDICFIPDKLFDKIYAEQGTQTRTLLYLSNQRAPAIEEYIIEHIDKSLNNRGLAKPDYMECCLHTFASIRNIAKHYQTPLLPYVFSAVRMVHGYTQTLYMAHFDDELFGSKYAEKMYQRYDPDNNKYPLLDKHEIMALLGKKRNLPLIPLMDIEGKYELGVMVECFQITPQTYQNDFITDDDLYYEANRWYSKTEIQTRVHPIKMDCFGISRRYVKNDPAPFLIKCKRFTTVQSQMITKAAMWNRVPCVLGDALPYSFLFSRDFRSKEVVSNEKLNFLLFGYFVPDICMFDSEYWKWRKTEPSVEAIIERHMDSIVSQLGYDKEVLVNKEGRLEKLLRGRGCSQVDIQSIMSQVSPNEIVEECMSSRVDIIDNCNTMNDFYCRNVRMEPNTILSHFELPETGERARVLLLDDVEGTVAVDSVEIDGKEVIKNICKHLYKGDALCEIKLEGATVIDVKWRMSDSILA